MRFPECVSGQLAVAVAENDNPQIASEASVVSKSTNTVPLMNKSYFNYSRRIIINKKLRILCQSLQKCYLSQVQYRRPLVLYNMAFEKTIMYNDNIVQTVFSLLHFLCRTRRPIFTVQDCFIRLLSPYHFTALYTVHYY